MHFPLTECQPLINEVSSDLFEDRVQIDHLNHEHQDRDQIIKIDQLNNQD